jgi:transposase
MRRGLAVTWPVTAEELGARAAKEPCGRLRARLLAMRLVCLGESVPAAARAVGTNRRRVVNWVHRINAEGPEGLADRPRSGRPSYLGDEETSAFVARIEAGPRAAGGGPDGPGARMKDRQHRLRCAGPDARRILADEFGAAYSTGGTYALLHRLGRRSRSS